MNIYISGPITGTCDAQERFAKAQHELYDQYAAWVVNPEKVLAMLPGDTKYEQYIKASMCLLEMCDTIYMLKGWQNSKGALLEWRYAKTFDYKIIYEGKEKITE